MSTDAYELWPGNAFGQQEHPPSAKFNAILQIAEKTRKFTGPFNIRALQATGVAYQPTATGYFLQLEDDPWKCGGVNTATAKTNRTFQVFYYDGNEAATTAFARWDDVIFTSGTIDGTEYWWVQLNQDNLALGALGGSDLHLSSANVSISSFTCYRLSG